MLGLTQAPFWQEESYDHMVRNLSEFENIRNYIEENPVRAGLATEGCQYRWSSAGGATGGSPADRGGPPHWPTPYIITDESQPKWKTP